MQQPPADPDAWRSRVGLPPPSALALLLIELNPAIADRIVVSHVADAHGCCRVCSLPQGGIQAWPCTLYAVATEVHDVLRARGLPRPAD